MRVLRVVACALLCLLGPGLVSFPLPAPTFAKAGLLPPLFDLAHIPHQQPVPVSRVFSGLPALAVQQAAPATVGVSYLAVGATVISPTARLPLAGTGFAPGATVVITDNGTWP